MEVRTRFAPSPTGYLHIGGVRTALFNWLFARHNKGKFILRIEDTDTGRSTEEAVNVILDGMKWLDLEWDEGPFFQSKRLDIYKEHVEKLLSNGMAYRCYCSAEELKRRKEEAFKKGLKPKYDGKCRDRHDKPEGVSCVVRFKSPTSGTTVIRDMIRGNVYFDNSELDDLIIMRSDGMPTYNLCVVVDDFTMGITHVIRGDDHLNNTPRQVLLYNAFGNKPPQFAHVSMILGDDKARLSKRHGATSVTAYRDMGYLPEALINYLARLGWSHGDQEIFSMKELVEHFSLENVGKSSAVFNPEKLIWLNTHYIKEKDNEELAGLLLPFIEKMGYKAEGDKRLPLIVGTLKERVKTLEEMASSAEFYFKDDFEYDGKAERKFLKAENRELLISIKNGLSFLEPFDHNGVEGVFVKVMEETEKKLGKIAQPVRVALTGGTVSPGIFETIEAMGKEKTLMRLERAIEKIKESVAVQDV